MGQWVRVSRDLAEGLQSPESVLFVLNYKAGTGSAGGTGQCRRHKGCGFHPWVGKVPWRRVWQPTRVFLPGESPWTEEPGRLQSMGLQSDVTEAT